MDNREVALELLRMYLDLHRERVQLDELVDAYLYILDVLEHGHGDAAQQVQGPAPGAPAPPPADDDSLFDFKQPLSASDKEA